MSATQYIYIYYHQNPQHQTHGVLNLALSRVLGLATPLAAGPPHTGAQLTEYLGIQSGVTEVNA